MKNEVEIDKEIEEWLNDYTKQMKVDEPWIISLEPVIDDIVKTKNIDRMEEKILSLQRRFEEGQGLLNAIKKTILQAFALELKNGIDQVEKERVKKAIIKLFGFDVL